MTTPLLTPVANEQDETEGEICHWFCSTCYPLLPASAYCGFPLSRTVGGSASETDHLWCVVCDFMVRLPCEGCGE